MNCLHEPEDIKATLPPECHPAAVVQRSSDRELATMALVVHLFEELEGEARRRVQRCLNDRYGRTDDRLLGGIATSTCVATANDDVLCGYYIVARVTRQWERALLTGFWLQQVRPDDDFSATSINKIMRRCDYAVSNITREMGKLANDGMIVAQLKSARHRRFRLSPAGERWCLDRLGPASL